MPERPGRKVIVHSKRRVFDDFYSIDQVEVSFEGRSGEMVGPVRRLSFERGDSVAALVLRHGRSPTILLVEQFKYPVYVHDDGWITETVAGMIDPGESAEEALERELKEELGYQLAGFRHIATFYPSAGGSSERVYLYYCEVSDDDALAHHGGGLATEGEDIRIVELPVADFFERLAQSAFVDPKIIIAGLWLRPLWAAGEPGIL